jgi:hypothetical protein
LDQRASDIISHRLAAAVDRANGFYESESSRLIYLRTINPGITEQELEALAAEESACIAALKQTTSVLEGLRVCVAV